MSASHSTMIRPPAVAGLFYPADRGELARAVDELTGSTSGPQGQAPKALIVPHAGYIYSGAVAGRAYALLRPLRGRIRRVLLLGPAHRVALRGIAAPSARVFRTPLGDVPVDMEALASLRDLPQVITGDRAHEQEHALEVHLPFLQSVLGAFSLVPLVVGDTTPDEVAAVLDRLWGGEETLVVVSSDLSHYHGYAEARRIDGETVAAIAGLRTDIHPQQACGAHPVNGLNLCAGRRGLRPELLESCNSGDSAGDRNRVVGYAAFAYYGNDRHGR